jgi:hypothetical protein
MSPYEEDEKLVKHVLQNDEYKMEQAKEAKKWLKIDNFIDLVIKILEEAGRWTTDSAKYVIKLAEEAYNWFSLITDL